MFSIRNLAAVVAVALAPALFGAQAAVDKTVYPDLYSKPPTAALKTLKATVGRQFSSGYVFINGKYLPPPYKVERWGTAIRINGVQVTAEVIPWEEFIKTQKGVKVTKSETPVAEAEPAPVQEESVEEDEFEDDSESTLDDLFDDDPAPRKKTAKKRKVSYQPKPRKPEVTVSYSFDGEFVHNEKTLGYLERINKQRTTIDSRLRAGGYCCFGSRYRMATGDSKAADILMQKLPDLMKRHSNREAFVSAMFAAGFNYLPQSLIADLFRNRIDYVALERRYKDEAEKKKWSKLLDGAL